MKTQLSYSKTKRWVVKIGSASVTKQGSGLNTQSIAHWAAQIAQLRAAGKEIILVSSGAVAEGMNRLGWHKRPHALYELQAAAAVGQMGLIQTYETNLQKHGLHSAQVLLTHDDLANRKRYLNARTTLLTLLNLNVIPVINENDAVATEEIRFGDNDTLAALVSNLVEADLLIILTDQAGIKNTEDSANGEHRIIPHAFVDDPILDRVAKPISASGLGRGGMSTKVAAARTAAQSGATTIIASSREENILLRLNADEKLGTCLESRTQRLNARKQWITNQLKVGGTLFIDDGAARVLTTAGGSLLPVGVVRVEGNFQRGEMVECTTADGKRIARGLVNYQADETRKIMGNPSSEIEKILGYVDDPELIHRDNLVLIA